jgi:Glyoxalase/Bleomycin resistance protein/Dioxygenase superfamily
MTTDSERAPSRATISWNPPSAAPHPSPSMCHPARRPDRRREPHSETRALLAPRATDPTRQLRRAPSNDQPEERRDRHANRSHLDLRRRPGQGPRLLHRGAGLAGQDRRPLPRHRPLADGGVLRRPAGNRIVSDTHQRRRVALQASRRAAGSPAIAFSTDDCRRTYEELKAKAVVFVCEPKQMDYGGTDAVFEDRCGNLLNLHQD